MTTVQLWSAGYITDCVTGVGADLNTANTQKDTGTRYLDDQFVVI